MIFWDNFKICTDSVTITVAASGSNANPILDFGNIALRAKTLNLTTGFTIPQGTTFDGSVTLPSGSSVANALQPLRGSNGYTATLSGLTATTGSFTSVLAGGVTSDNIRALRARVEETLTVDGNLLATGAVSLPSNTSVGGYTWRPGPTQYNLLEIDGHLAWGDDWISVKNLSAQAIQVRVDLYNDYSAQNGYYSEYRVNGSPIWGQTTVQIGPGQSYSLNFRDADGDPFLANNGYIRVRYYLGPTVSESTQWQDINGDPIQAADIQGDPKAQRTFGNGEGLAEWFRSVLYENESGTEYWCVFSIANATHSTTVLSASFHNMLQRMSQLGYTHVALCGTEYHVAWQRISAVSPSIYYIGGVIGFLKAANS